MSSSAACWTAGQPAPYLHLARTFDRVEREKGKIKTTAMLCNMFRRFSAVYYFVYSLHVAAV
jgi:DNA ligase-1